MTETYHNAQNNNLEQNKNTIKKIIFDLHTWIFNFIRSISLIIKDVKIDMCSLLVDMVLSIIYGITIHFR